MSRPRPSDYRRALELGRKLGMRPLIAHVLFGLGRRNGVPQGQARPRRHLETAIAMFHEMGMVSWAAQAQSALTTTRS